MATIKDIAQLANVSFGTVSQTLRGNGDDARISKRTQQRIFEIAKSLNYKPNIAARELRTANNVPLFALFIKQSITSTALGVIVKAIHNIQMKNSCEFYYEIFPYSEELLMDIYEIIKSGRISGAIIAGVVAEEVAEEIDNWQINIPIVLLEQFSRNLSCVYIDTYETGRKIAEAIARKGHREVAVFYNTNSQMNVSNRIRGLRDAGAKYGMNLHEYTSSGIDDIVNEGYFLTKQMWQGDSKPTIAFYDHNDFSIGALRAYYEMGIKIPQDIEILAYGLDGNNDYMFPSISILKIPLSEMAVYAVNLLLETFQNEENCRKAICFDATFSFKESFLP